MDVDKDGGGPQNYILDIKIQIFAMAICFHIADLLLSMGFRWSTKPSLKPPQHKI